MMASIHKTAVPPMIDGVLDDDCWKDATPIKGDFVLGKKGVVGATPRLKVRFAWDEHYLYIAYECKDKTLQAIGTGELQGPADHKREGLEIGVPNQTPDVVEFFISFGSESCFWELHHNALNQWNDVLCIVAPESSLDAKSTLFNGCRIRWIGAEWLNDEGPYKLRTAARLLAKRDGEASTVNDDSDEDSGYAGEMRIPWRPLGPPIERETTIEAPDPNDPTAKIQIPVSWHMAGQEIRIFAAAQDGASKNERYHHTSPTLVNGFFHVNASEWPRYRLVE